MSTIFRAASLLVLLVGCTVVGLRGGTAGARPLDPLSDAGILRRASAQVAHEPARVVVRWLRSQAPVRDVLRGRDGRTLTVRFRDGIQGDIVPKTIGTIGYRSPVAGPRLRPFVQPRVPGTARAAVWEPFATELGLGPYAGQPEVSALQTAGFQVDSAYDTSVTIETFTTMAQYSVIYLHTHSGVDGAGRALVGSGEPVNGDPGVQQYLADGTVVVIAVAGSSQTYYGITSAFIRLHVGTFPSDAIVFVNGCELLASTDFSQALTTRGAGVLISWDHLGSAQDDFLSAAVFFQQMDGGQSVAQAIASTLAAGYGKSTYQGQLATLGYQGNGSVTLADAARGRAGGGATSTPAPPTSTPVVPTIQPTRAPSATPLPTRIPPALRLGLLAAVKPCCQQTIELTFAPNTTVHVFVTFPNGDVMERDVVTDGNGAASFVFRQPGSEITRNDSVATVTAVAQEGSTPVSTTGHYLIEYGHIDVSVEPRKRHRGQSVSVWIHAHARASVSALVTGPHIAPTAWRGKTGVRGWARFKFTIPAAAHRGERLTVRATRTVGKSHYRTKTTFTVS